MGVASAQHVASVRWPLLPQAAQALIILHGFLAAMIVRLNFPLFEMWLLNPGDRLRSFRYYSPLIEISIAAYVLCAIGLRASKRWAWWMALGMATFFTLTHSALLVRAGAERGAPWPWAPIGSFLALRDVIQLGPEFMRLELLYYTLSLASFALLLIPASVSRHFGILGWLEFRSRLVAWARSTLLRMDERLQFAAIVSVLLRIVAVVQILVCLGLYFLLPYGLGRLPHLFAIEVFGIISALLMFQQLRIGRVLSLIWWAWIPAFRLTAFFYFAFRELLFL